MKIKYLLLLLLSNGAFAEPRALPPVIDNSTYPGGSAYAGGKAPSNNAMYELLGRLEQLQQEVQQLRGRVEEQEHRIAELKKRQSNIYSDLDQRLQTLSGVQQNGGMHTPPSATVQEPLIAAQSQQAIKASVSKHEAVIETEKQRYQHAYETLRNGHNTQAIAEFKALLTDFPVGEYADNAQYWLAEAYKVNQDTRSATAAFTQVVERYPDSPKVPDALLKLGYIELEQHNKAKARDYLTRITVNYPGTTAAHLAEKKLLQIDH